VIWGSSDIVWTRPQSWAEGVIWGSDSIGASNDEGVIWGSTEGMTSGNTEWRTPPVE
jgi:hypothetical protein